VLSQCPRKYTVPIQKLSPGYRWICGSAAVLVRDSERQIARVRSLSPRKYTVPIQKLSPRTYEDIDGSAAVVCEIARVSSLYPRKYTVPIQKLSPRTYEDIDGYMLCRLPVQM
jgi:hypothetical protein